MDVKCEYFFPKPIWRTSLPRDVALEPIVDQIYKLEKSTESRHRSNKGPLNFQSGDFEYHADRKDDPINDLLFSYWDFSSSNSSIRQKRRGHLVECLVQYK